MWDIKEQAPAEDFPSRMLSNKPNPWLGLPVPFKRRPGTKEPPKPSDVPMETKAECTGTKDGRQRWKGKIMLAGDARGCVSFKLATCK